MQDALIWDLLQYAGHYYYWYRFGQRFNFTGTSQANAAIVEMAASVSNMCAAMRLSVLHVPSTIPTLK